MNQVDENAEQNLADWITTFLEQKMDLPAGSFRTDKSFDAYGVDSIVAVELMGELSEKYGQEFSPTLMYKCSTAERLAAYIEREASLEEA